MSAYFLPFSVRGAAGIGPGAWHGGDRRSIRLAVTISADPRRRRPVHADLTLLGPGEVLGIDPAQVVRRTPAPGELDMAPNHLATIELAHPDLPWLFSADPDPKPDKMVPWLMLVVVEQEPGAELITRPALSPNPLLTVAGSLLPDPEHAWAWAHVQVEAPDGAAARAYLSRQGPWPLARSRLIAPCCLRPGKSYLACLVPVFEAGVRAGSAGLAETGGILYWKRNERVRLPVYDYWGFRTGTEGDFKTLACALERPKTFECGYRRVVVDDVAARLRLDGDPPLFNAQVRNVPTALSRGDAPGRPPLPPPLAGRLKALLDRTAAGSRDKPIVGPPLYGQWAAGVDSLDGRPDVAGMATTTSSGPQAWVAELNTDPDLRVVAGLGARMVQLHQEELMAEAWAQLEQVEEANRRIRWAQLAAAVGTPLHDDFAALPPGQALRIAHSLLVPDVAAPVLDLAATNVPEELFDPAFLRVARYAAILPSPAPDHPDDHAAESVSPADILEATVAALHDDWPEVRPVHVAESPQLDVGQILEAIGHSDLDAAVRAEALEEVTRLDNAVRTVEPEEVAHLTEALAELKAVAPLEDTLVTWIGRLPPASPALPQLHVLEAGTDDVARVLDPESSYQDMLADAIEVNQEDSPNRPYQRSPLHPVMASPVFLTPAVELLRAMDQEWVLGGLGALGDVNVITVLTENQRFVEAYLAGANHEMARELRWRGYPTDLRGSYFRRFWPTFDTRPDDDPLEGINDVKPLHEWVGPLGGHRTVDTQHLLVIVIKGALLRRYPNTVITVEFGSHTAQAFTSVREATKLASGTLDPDFAYLIVDADPLDEQGGRRWYVSLREPTDEPSLGLDAEEATRRTFLTPDEADQHARPERQRTSLAAVEWLFRRPFQLLQPARELLTGGGT